VRAGCAAALLGLCLALAACGDDEEPADTGGTAPETAPATERAPATETERTEAETETEAEGPEDEPSPEDQPGGAGDEEEIRTEARLVGRGGRVIPDDVRVPPFIGVRVHIRSADNAEYGFSCAGRRVQVDADIETASTTLPGRRAGAEVPCRALGDHNDVRIVFSAEPGP
jgi:hypothetical protein